MACWILDELSRVPYDMNMSDTSATPRRVTSAVTAYCNRQSQRYEDPRTNVRAWEAVKRRQVSDMKVAFPAWYQFKLGEGTELAFNESVLCTN